MPCHFLQVMTMAGMAPLLLCFYCVVIGLYFRSLNAVQVSRHRSKMRLPFNPAVTHPGP
jgi:hypothetical protein